MLECVFCLEFVTGALSARYQFSWGQTRSPSSPASLSLQEWGSTWPLVLYLRALSCSWPPFSASSLLPQNGLPAWSSTCCGFTATPGSHLPPVVLNGILLILSIIMTWMKSLGTWESLDLHLGFIFNLEEKTLLSYVIIRSEEQTHSPGDSK